MDGQGQTSQTLIKAADSTDGRTRCASILSTPDRVASHLFLLDERFMAGAPVLSSSPYHEIRIVAVRHHRREIHEGPTASSFSVRAVRCHETAGMFDP